MIGYAYSTHVSAAMFHQAIGDAGPWIQTCTGKNLTTLIRYTGRRNTIEVDVRRVPPNLRPCPTCWHGVDPRDEP